MALLNAGWFQTTWFPSRWWQEDWWLEYGTAVVLGGDSARYYYFKKKKPENEVLGYLAELLRKIKEQTS